MYVIPAKAGIHFIQPPVNGNDCLLSLFLLFPTPLPTCPPAPFFRASVTIFSIVFRFRRKHVKKLTLTPGAVINIVNDNN
jgi:hypothetical protein